MFQFPSENYIAFTSPSSAKIEITFSAFEQQHLMLRGSAGNNTVATQPQMHKTTADDHLAETQGSLVL